MNRSFLEELTFGGDSNKRESATSFSSGLSFFFFFFASDRSDHKNSGHKWELLSDSESPHFSEIDRAFF